MRVLVVDDDPVARELASAALGEAGYEVTAAADGAEAMALLEGSDIRLVISDWMMPEMDGLQLCQAIREATLPGYVYVILLTGRQQRTDIVAGLEAGADDFITKPFDPAELRVRVKVARRILSLETRHVAIFALAKLAESRDPETGQHLERIRDYCLVLSRELRERGTFPDVVNEQFIQNIYLTSPLHDIGKVGIPDSVLLKPDRLSDREFEIMKAHAAIGAATLDAAVRQYPEVDYLRMARDIALTHHERVDGSGYPQQLRGDDIPICGRIVAVADVYDAMTTRRVYKKAFDQDVARSLILEGNGTHFDPRIIDAFVAAESRFIEISHALGDGSDPARELQGQAGTVG